MSAGATLDHFVDRLTKAVCEKRSHVVVGLDPHLHLIPQSIRERASYSDRKSLAEMVTYFCIEVLDAVGDLVPAVKPQVAFFERLGSHGLASLEKVISSAKNRGVLVISDGKRGDIGSTAEAYAEAHIGYYQDEHGNDHEVLGADAVTVDAYFGSESLGPFLKWAGKGKGIFVIGKTSNPSSSDLQDCIVRTSAGEKPVYEAVADIADRLGSRILGRSGFGAAGLVVGATHPEQAMSLRVKYPRLYFLVPGYGAQGASAADIVGCFNATGLGAIVNASRSILFAYREPDYEHLAPADWQTACREAARRMRDDINRALADAGKSIW